MTSLGATSRGEVGSLGSPVLQQEIRFCTTEDGVTIAYACVGRGQPLVRTLGWFTNLEMEWAWPAGRRFWERLAQRHLLVRYNGRGIGLSDRDVEVFSLDTSATDTKMNRDVALKVLPQAFTNDPDRLARFEREAWWTLAPKRCVRPARISTGQPPRAHRRSGAAAHPVACAPGAPRIPFVHPEPSRLVASRFIDSHQAESVRFVTISILEIDVVEALRILRRSIANKSRRDSRRHSRRHGGDSPPPAHPWRPVVPVKHLLTVGIASSILTGA